MPQQQSTPVDRAARTAFRQERLLHDLPTALYALGGAMIAFDILSYPLGYQEWAGAVIYFVMGVNMLVTGWAASRVTQHPHFAVPAMSYVSTFNVFGSLLYVYFDQRILVLVYALFIMLVSPAFVMSLTAMAALTPLWVSGVAVTIANAPGVLVSEIASHWLIATVMSQGMGLVIMVLRIRALDEIGRLTALARTLATRDNLTDTLNRHGLEEQIPGLLARATRAGQDVYVCFFDVDGLKGANDTHGHEFGDEVLVTVARAVRETAVPGCLLARWGGDEFIALGAGPAPDGELWAHRIREHIAASGIDRQKWPGAVSVGTAQTAASACDIDRLISTADGDMYELRRARRGQ